VSDRENAPAAAPEYRGRRRVTPSGQDPASGSGSDPELIDLTVVEAPPPLTRLQLLQQRRALEEALEASQEAELPPPVTRRQIAEQRRSEESHATFGPSLSAVALGAAGVAMVAVVAGRVYGGPVGPASAADQLPTVTSSTTTMGQASTRVDPTAAMAALRRGEVSPLPAGLRAVSRSKMRPVLPGCDGRVSDYSYANGQVPSNELCALTFAPGHHLRADAAVSLAMLNIAYRTRFGQNMCLTDSYRTLGAQASLAARKPGLAARPGTSEHGMGLAVDFCGGVQTYRSQRYDWMRANAPTFGWANPAWAIPPSSREEPWHWEYVVGEKKTAAA
jgi:D-alanyl-D-alanine carboxypeptidase